jgi:hypothetical protein
VSPPRSPIEVFKLLELYTAMPDSAALVASVKFPQVDQGPFAAWASREDWDKVPLEGENAGWARGERAVLRLVMGVK